MFFANIVAKSDRFTSSQCNTKLMATHFTHIDEYISPAEMLRFCCL